MRWNGASYVLIVQPLHHVRGNGGELLKDAANDRMHDPQFRDYKDVTRTGPKCALVEELITGARKPSAEPFWLILPSPVRKLAKKYVGPRRCG
jgi:hypothetical protein